MVKVPKPEIIGELEEAALHAFEAGHVLQAAVIRFQNLEILLRIAVTGYSRSRGASERTVERVTDPRKRIIDLLDHLDLVCPKNKVSEQLRKLNQDRNRIMHRLFFLCESLEDLNIELSEFCLNCLAAEARLRTLLEGEPE